jgi:hypothetical protein
MEWKIQYVTTLRMCCMNYLEFNKFYGHCMVSLEHAEVQLVEELRYKQEVRGFGSRSFQWDFLLT